MISLFTLYNILETGKYEYNEEFGGYYLAHNENKVVFGYIYPLDKTQFAFTKDFSLNEVTELKKTFNGLYHIPTLEEIKFIHHKNIYDIYYKYWSCWVLVKTKIVNYDFYAKRTESSNQNHRIILIRDVSILK
jgi:hypothetical protein